MQEIKNFTPPTATTTTTTTTTTTYLLIKTKANLTQQYSYNESQ
jgi:hypothetical protein